MNTNWIRKMLELIRRFVRWVKKKPGPVKRYFLFVAGYDILLGGGLFIGILPATAVMVIDMITTVIGRLFSMDNPIAWSVWGTIYLGLFAFGIVLGVVNMIVSRGCITSVYDFKKAGIDASNGLLVDENGNTGRAIWGKKAYALNMPEFSDGKPIEVPFQIPEDYVPKGFVVEGKLLLAQWLDAPGTAPWYRCGFTFGNLLRYAKQGLGFVEGIRRDLLDQLDEQEERFLAINVTSLEEVARSVLKILQTTSFGSVAWTYSISVTVIDTKKQAKVEVW